TTSNDAGTIAPIYTRYRWRLCLERTSPVGGVAVGDRHPLVPAEGARRDLDSRRSLPALVLAAVDELDHACDRLWVVTRGDQLLGAEVLLDVAHEDRVELFVRREAVGVLLSRLQLGRRRLGDHALRDHLAERVAVAAELVNGGLGDVLEHGETARSVAVQRAVARRDLGLVAGR